VSWSRWKRPFFASPHGSAFLGEPEIQQAIAPHVPARLLAIGEVAMSCRGDQFAVAGNSVVSRWRSRVLWE